MIQQNYFGNSIENYIWFASILLVGILFRKYFSQALSWIAYKFLKNYSKGQIGFEKFLFLIRKPISSFIILLTLYLSFTRLSFPIEWHIATINEMGVRLVISKSFQTAIIISFTWIVLRFIDFLGIIFMYRASLTESKMDDQLVPFLKEGIKIIVAIISVFFIMGIVYKLNITSLIAGLGIGGLAVALAAKETLENLIGSFTIFIDKPFVIGDLVKMGTLEGTIEKIGFRSTRIRTLDKSFVTVPNKKLVDTELDNYTLREVRRVKFDFNLAYNTPHEKIKTICKQITDFITEHEMKADKPYVYLFLIAEYSIQIRVIYFVNTNDWEVYMNIRQEINYKIMEIVANNNCNFAYPTSVVELTKQPE